MNKALAYIGIALLIGGCGSSSSDTKDINVTDYLPATSQSKSFLTTHDGSTDIYKEDVTVDGNKITIKVDDKISRVYTVNDSNITVENGENELVATFNKYLDVGDTLYTTPTTQKVENITLDDTILGTRTIETTISCKLDSQLEKFDDYDIATYTGDILKFKCTRDEEEITKVEDDLPSYINLSDGQETTAYDIYYFYMQKDKGIIAYIDNNCTITNENGNQVVDDRVDGECEETHYTHTFYVE